MQSEAWECVGGTGSDDSVTVGAVGRTSNGIGAITGLISELSFAIGACAWSAGTLAPDFISQQEPRCWLGISEITGEPAPFIIIEQPTRQSLTDLAGTQLATTANAVEDIATVMISIRAASWRRRDIGKFEGTLSRSTDL